MLTKKKADDLSGDTTENLEQSFAQLAYTYVKNRAPLLLDKLIGFQLVDKAEAGDRLVGVFGFKLGKSIFYIPVFFVSGRCVGHELLYDVAHNMMQPSKDNWVTELLSRVKSIDQGQKSEQDAYQQGALDPNLTRLVWPMGRAKSAAFRAHPIFAPAPWVQFDAIKWMHDVKTKSAAELKPVMDSPMSVLNGALDLTPLLEASPRAVKLARHLYKHYPMFKAGFDTHYGADLLDRCEKDQKAWPEFRLFKSAEAPVRFDDVEVYNFGDERLITMPEDVKRAALLDGFVLVDKREKAAGSVYTLPASVSLSSPPQSGVYDVYTAGGGHARALVALGPKWFNDAEMAYDSCPPVRPAVVVTLEDGGARYVAASSDSIWVFPDTFEDVAAAYEAAEPASSMVVDSAYVLVAPSGETTAPFTLRRKIKDNVYAIDRVTRYSRLSSGPWYQSAILTLDDDCLSVQSTPGGAAVTAPAGSKVIKLRNPSGSGDPVAGLGADRAELTLGDNIKFKEYLYAQTHRVKVAEVHGDYTVTGDGFKLAHASYPTTLVQLMRRYSLKEAEARAMLKAAAGTVRVFHVTKTAAEPEPNYAVPMPGPTIGTEPVGRYNAVPAQYATSTETPVPGLESSRTDLTRYDPFLPSKSDVGVGGYGSGGSPAGPQSQTKDEFDVSVFKAMLSASSDELLVDRYIGPLVQAVDAVGRLLFTLYWHMDDFEERYGQPKLPQLEDALRNVFDNLADLVLELKSDQMPLPVESAISPDIGAAANN